MVWTVVSRGKLSFAIYTLYIFPEINIFRNAESEWRFFLACWLQILTWFVLCSCWNVHVFSLITIPFLWFVSLSQCPLTWQNKWEGPEEPMQYLRAIVTRALAIQVTHSCLCINSWSEEKPNSKRLGTFALEHLQNRQLVMTSLVIIKGLL